MLRKLIARLLGRTQMAAAPVAAIVAAPVAAIVYDADETSRLQALARECAAQLKDPDKKQLRFNEIIATARVFYSDAAVGVCELVASCDRAKPNLYVKGRPMWRTLRDEYGWMLAA